MNKTIASLSAAVAVGGSSLSALVPVAADLGVTSDLTFASEYNFRGYELADNSFQPSIEASLGDFYLGLFANLPIDTARTGPKNAVSELQYYGGFAVEVPGVEGLFLDVGGTVYHWRDVGLDRTHEAYVGTKFEDVGLPGVSAAVYYFYDFDRRAHVAEGSIGYSFALDQAGDLSLDVSGVYGEQFGGSIKNRGIRVNENYTYYGASVEVPLRLNEFSTLTAGAHYQTAEGADLDNALGGVARGQNFFWTISYTAGF